MQTIFMNWQLSNSFGWGILGLNIFCQWANDPHLRPVMGQPIKQEDVFGLDPLRLVRILPAIMSSNNFLEGLVSKSGLIRIDATAIDCLGNGFVPSTIAGKRNIGRCVFEDTHFGDIKKPLSKYETLLCGSHWNADLLRAASGREAKVIFEGVDPSLFCPGPKSGMMDRDVFHVFSGGKIEYRKGQDLVLLAFREFSKRHDDAVLVTAWHSPWPQFSVGFKGRLAVPLELDQNGALNITKWATDNGVGSNKIVDIGRVPNQMMPIVLREMDAALQPSRAEACTNLPAKEAMACAVPVIVANNTGMKDLITAENCLALNTQRPVTGGLPMTGTDGWGESDVDEIVQALEALYADRERRQRVGRAAANWVMENRTWERHAAELRDFVLAVS